MSLLSVPSVITFLSPDFIHNDDRGEIIQIVRSGWRQINYLRRKENSVAGGHFHKNNDELFYTVEGQFDLSLKYKNIPYRYSISKSDMFIIHAGVIHTFYFNQDTSLISMYSNGVEEKNGLDMYNELI